ncbi:DnaA regulatory inactivator Hda [Methylonatrum kenyense]|uniref:DnaA regulatory inactivator Hda n=1 Tax=Methylonatrum kenyense TaxID=455253 RepID=UPI0020C13E76|nr:DnaA regulatory inactivator Hda [Methylonatrum kenyense]MCK8516083.1 DnaA regulatory inactivator Hda [Methylonatrum kenyense]
MPSSNADQLRQLALRIGWEPEATLEQFVAGANSDALAALRGELGSDSESLVIYGAAGTGKTHLLQAACRELAGGTSSYVPLAAASELSPALLEGLDAMTLVALDDLQAIAGHGAWEEAVFHLFNGIRARGGRLVLAARQAPSALGLLMPDLTSRLQWGLVYRLQPLDEDALLAALQNRARQRGLELPSEVGRFLLNRFPRDCHSLFGLLETLDRAALAAQRRLTIPFVRQVLGLS